MGELNSLKTKAVSGIFWSMTELLTSQVIQFVVLMILARLLSPENFGVIGMITIFIVISTVIIESGFSQALIREKNISQEDYSTVFYFNLFMSILLYITLFIFAPIISDFFKEEQLIPILRVLSLRLIINSLGFIQKVMLTRNINFRTQTKISVLSAFVASLIAIILAWKGYEIWSLVAQSLTWQTIQTVLLWSRNKWVPSFIFSMTSFKRLFGFGSKLLISGIIDTIYKNIYSIIIGRVFSAVQLGYYTNAAKLGDVITVSVTGALQRVTYPVLSSIQEDENRLREGYQNIIKMTVFAMFPIMTGLLAISDSLILLLFGENWYQSIIYFKLLCIAGMLYPLHALNLNILQVKGRSDLFLRLEIIKKGLLTLLIGASLFFSLGITGIIWAGIISSYLSFFINALYSNRVISYSICQQFKDILPALMIAILMSGIVYILGRVLPESIPIKLIVQVFSGTLLYLIFCWIFKLKEFGTISQLISKYIKVNKSKLKSRGV